MLKLEDIEPFFATSYARILERIEIIRSRMRWSSQLDRSGIEKILHQINTLREEILLVSRAERCKQEREIPSCSGIREQNNPHRRQALSDRGFVFEGVFGENPKLIELLELVEKVADTGMPVLIEGESGTGKELLAKIIHANSDRADQPFISVNCGAIVGTLLESELFGHVKGAFTGSVKDRKGKFEAADKGTIFLDEIGEISPENQVKLLRVLENGEIQRVGSDEVMWVNTRILAATNRNLYEMTSEGKFREDLYYRLSVIAVRLPPLRERRDELPLLIAYFCTEASEKLNRPVVNLSPQLHRFLMNYAFRGNIRELRNIIYRISCIADDVAGLEHLPEMIRPADSELKKTQYPEKFLSLDDVRKAAMDAAEKQFLKEQLREVKGNVTVLAKKMGMNRSYLQTLLKKQEIHAKDFKVISQSEQKSPEPQFQG